MTAMDPFGICGTVVDGRYRVERVIGQGGFGVVYRAHHLGFESPIALKVLKLPDEWSSARRDARLASFQREGRVLFELSQLHSSIVRAFETGTIRGRDGSLAPYLALEWLDGVSLDRELKSRRALGMPPLSFVDTLELLHAPIAGLTRAHARGIAHRDIKPGNLFIGTRGGEQSVKILDFGIAKLVNDAIDTTERFAGIPGVTASFTPLYAAPEQWLERLGGTGTWTDVHALALVAVELVTGSPPFAGREPAQLMGACLHDTRPTPGARGVTLPPEVEAVFARALALEPSERYPNAGAFWTALCSAAQWRERNAPQVLELTTRGGNASDNPSLAPVVTAPTSPTGSTATTAPPTARHRAFSRKPSSRWPKATAPLVLFGSAVIVAYGFAGRVSPGQPQTPSALTTATALPAPSAILAEIPPPRPPAPPPETALTHAPVAPSLTSPPTRPRAPTTARPSSHAPPATPRVPAESSAPIPSIPPAPAVTASSHPSTASVALPAEETTAKRRNPPVNLDDPGLLQRK